MYGSVKTTVCRIFSWLASSVFADRLFEIFRKIVWDDRARALSAACERRRESPNPRHQDPGSARNKYAGGHRIRVPPVPIPNTEVKPATADGTAWETVWESRSLPALFV